VKRLCEAKSPEGSVTQSRDFAKQSLHEAFLREANVVGTENPWAKLRQWAVAGHGWPSSSNPNKLINTQIFKLNILCINKIGISSNINQSNLFINSPLEQFEVTSLLGLNAK
jgi:hypothetical protein